MSSATLWGPAIVAGNAGADIFRCLDETPSTAGRAPVRRFPPGPVAGWEWCRSRNWAARRSLRSQQEARKRRIRIGTRTEVGPNPCHHSSSSMAAMAGAVLLRPLGVGLGADLIQFGPGAADILAGPFLDGDIALRHRTFVDDPGGDEENRLAQDLVLRVLRNNAPRTGMSFRKGTPLTLLMLLSSNRPPMTKVSLSGTSTLVWTSWEFTSIWPNAPVPGAEFSPPAD